MSPKCSILLFICLLAGMAPSGLTAQASKPGKKALLIGIGNYPASGGWTSINSQNDIVLVREALLKQGFREEDIRILKDQEATHAGIAASLKDLQQRVQKGDVVYFHFSGHGQQCMDQDGDEIDGLDESLVPFDSPKDFKEGVYEGENLFRDEELGQALEAIREKSGSQGHVIALLDACHSGTGTRGSAIARGTQQVMASPAQMAKLQSKAFSKENNRLTSNQVSRKEASLAPLVCFFGSAQNQLNYEMTNDKGEHFGSLSYAFCKYFVQAKPEESYRYLFERIRTEMSTIAPMQNPQSEGALDMEVLNGKAVAALDHYLVKSINDAGEVFVDAGSLQGINEGAVLGLYPPDTRNLEKAVPLAKGRVIKTQATQSQVRLDSVVDASVIRGAWVFELEKSFGELKARILIRLDQPSLAEKVRQDLSAHPFIQFQDKDAELEIWNADRSGRKFLFLGTSSGYALDSVSYNDQAPPNTARFVNKLKKYLKGNFLRQLDMAGNEIDLDFDIIPIRSVQEGKTPEEMESLKAGDDGVLRISVGDTILIRVRNHSYKTAYFTLLDIQPDNVINVLLPGPKQTPEEMRIPPEGTILVPTYFQMGEPLGNEIFKLVASDKPMDLKAAYGTRGGVNQNPFEKMYAELGSDEIINTRGGRALNLNSADIQTKAFSFQIVQNK